MNTNCWSYSIESSTVDYFRGTAATERDLFAAIDRYVVEGADVTIDHVGTPDCDCKFIPEFDYAGDRSYKY